MKNFLIIYLSILFSIGQVNAQCFEADASIWLNPWTSCNTSISAIPDYGASHWIQYDFGTIRKLSKTWVWNVNNPSNLNQGFKNVKVDYSSDGIHWTHWGEMQFPKAEGNTIYGGFAGPDMFGLEAQYILLTATSNHGDASCYGITEIKFNLLPDEVGLPNNGEGGDDEECAAIEEIYVEEVTDTEAFIWWEYDGELEVPEFTFAYAIEGEDEWIELEVEAGEDEVFLEELEVNTSYEFVVGFECEGELFVSEIFTFTTSEEDGEGEECAAIEEIYVEEVTDTEAFVWWEYDGELEAPEFTFAYAIEGEDEWIELEVEAGEDEMFLEELEAGTTYNFILSFECEGELFVSEIFTFTTNEEGEEDGEVGSLSTGIEDVSEPQLTLFPNPFQEAITLKYTSEKEDVVNLYVRTVEGRAVYHNTILIESGENSLELSLTDLPVGMYYLQMVSLSNHYSIVEKVLKTNR